MRHSDGRKPPKNFRTIANCFASMMTHLELFCQRPHRIAGVELRLPRGWKRTPGRRRAAIGPQTLQLLSRGMRTWQPDATLIDDALQSDFDFRHVAI